MTEQGARSGGVGAGAGVVRRAHQRPGLDVREAERRRRTRASAANSSGVHHFTTGRCCAVGRRYWPIVTMSTPTPRRSTSAARTSSARLAHPEDEPRLRHQAGVLGAGEHRQRPRVPGRRARRALQPRDRLEVVVEHVGPRVEDRRAANRRRPGSRRSATRPASNGLAARIACTVSAKMRAPPSARSSRATQVTTACASRIVRTASATRRGSSSSTGNGLRVSTRQNPHARVQRSPRIMKVAVRSAQHS